MYKKQTKSEDETLNFGASIGENVFAGMLILLFGDLGSGKTHFTKGVARGMHIHDTVSSPTYTILFEHTGNIPLYHFDLYRITDEDDFFEIGGYEYLAKKGVSIIEWAERLDWEEYDRLEVHIEIVDDNTREIRMAPYGQRYEEWLKNYEQR
ncbi:MAG: tRNA (adenosine(37)-N6)-threonylcarbamoyltransferase complex ATPase subunit type 1 TsaE [Eubacteriales bacterium]